MGFGGSPELMLERTFGTRSSPIVYIFFKRTIRISAAVIADDWNLSKDLDVLLKGLWVGLSQIAIFQARRPLGRWLAWRVVGSRWWSLERSAEGIFNWLVGGHLAGWLLFRLWPRFGPRFGLSKSLFLFRRLLLHQWKIEEWKRFGLFRNFGLGGTLASTPAFGH